MIDAEILREDLSRVERRKNEPFRKERVFQMLQYLYLNLNFYKIKIVLPLVGTNILQHVSKKEDKEIDKE
jgi:hypothetical protein